MMESKDQKAKLGSSSLVTKLKGEKTELDKSVTEGGLSKRLIFYGQSWTKIE